jgi:hypothetical protein
MARANAINITPAVDELMPLGPQGTCCRPWPSWMPLLVMGTPSGSCTPTISCPNQSTLLCQCAGARNHCRSCSTKQSLKRLHSSRWHPATGSTVAGHAHQIRQLHATAKDGSTAADAAGDLMSRACGNPSLLWLVNYICCSSSCDAAASSRPA